MFFGIKTFSINQLIIVLGEITHTIRRTTKPFTFKQQ